MRNCFEEFFSGPARHFEVPRLITDGFTFRDPTMSADSADEYVEMLPQLGDEMDMRVEVRQIVGDGPQVAALVDLQGEPLSLVSPSGLPPQTSTMTVFVFARYSVISGGAFSGARKRSA